MGFKKAASVLLVVVMLFASAALADISTRAQAKFDISTIDGKAAVSKARICFKDMPGTMYVGTTYRVNVAHNITSGTLSYKLCTSNAKVLSIVAGSDNDAYAVPLKPGKARLTARINYNGKVYKATKTFNVKMPAITGVYVDSEATVTVGGAYTLSASVTPSTIANPTFKWSSSNKKIAKVSSSGVVTGVKEGTAVITVKAGSKSAKCRVTVTSSAPVTGTRRAFLFGMSLGDSGYSDYEFNALTSVYDEIISVSKLYASLDIPSKYYLNFTKSNLLSQMSSWKNGVSANDVTYVYYSGHGAVVDGQLEMIAGTDKAVTAKELRAKLDEIPGKVVLFLNCCQSGDAIGKSLSPNAFARAFVNEFVQPMSKSSEFVNAKYTVICACKSDEYGWIISGVDVYGDAFSKSLGWDLLGKYSTGTWLADANGNNELTLNEMSNYMRKSINNAIANDPDLYGETQTVVSYPTSSEYVLFEK